MSVELETENQTGFTTPPQNTLSMDIAEKKALGSILHGFYVTREDSPRLILDLWLEGAVQTVHVRIIADNNTDNLLIETWLGEVKIRSVECGIDIKSVITAVWVSAQKTVGRIGSIEFLLPGYHTDTVKEAADGAMKLGLCRTGKCTYVPEKVTLPHVDDVWYVRIKWRPTWRLSVEPETENQAGFRHCVPDIDSVGECVVCFDRLDWYGATGNTPVCLSCGHFLCARCLGEMEHTTIENRLEHWYMADRFQNKCPLCSVLYTTPSHWIPFPRISQEIWKGLGRFEFV